MEAKFKVGDKVKLTPAGSKAYPKFDNEVGTIEEIWKNVSYPYYLTFESGSQTYPVTGAEIEPVKTETQFKVGDEVYSPTYDHHGTVIEADVLFGGDIHHRVRLADGSVGLYEPHELELDLTLEDRVASLEKRLDALENPIVEETMKEETMKEETKYEAPRLSDLPYGSLIDTGAFIYVKTSENQWLAVLVSHTRENVSDKLRAYGPYEDDEFPDSTKVIREGV